MKILNALALVNPAALPALRVAGIIFLTIDLPGGAYLFRNRHRFFAGDPEVANDVSAARHLRLQVVLIPWLSVTAITLILLISFWRS